jgi:hypothetical protein
MSEIKTIGIAGAGTMGAGIAIVCARAGFRTRVFDLKQDALDRARSQTEGFLRKSVERGKLAAEKLPEIMSQWSGTTRLEDFRRLRLGHRSRVRELAGQARPLRQAGQDLLAASHLCEQHFHHQHHRDRGRLGPGRPIRRHSLLPAGAVDEAG